MERIEVIGTEVYLVKGEKRAETLYHLGRNPDLYEEDEAKRKTKKKRKKE